MIQIRMLDRYNFHDCCSIINLTAGETARIINTRRFGVFYQEVKRIKAVDLYFYEKEADAANYIFFHRYCNSKGDSESRMFLHFHDSVEFVFMISGKNRIHINTQDKIIGGGEVTFAQCFEPHYYLPEPGAEYYVVLISSQYLNAYTDFSKKVFPTFMEQNAHFHTVLEFLDLSYSLWGNANEAIKKGFAEMLIGLMKSFYPMEPVKSRKTTQTFVEILKYINEHFREEISLNQLANMFGYTRTYLSELFNEFTGMKLRDYINRCRINEYYKLKGEYAEMPQRNLAELSGFKSQNTFYRVLHKYPQQDAKSEDLESL